MDNNKIDQNILIDKIKMLKFKDIDLFIAFKLSDIDILNLSIVNKYCYKIYDNNFFGKLIEKRYPTVNTFDNSNKRLFVHIIYCLRKLKDINYIYTSGNPIVIYDIITTNDYPYILADSVRKNELALVKETFNNDDYFFDEYDSILSIAVQKNNFEILKYLIETGEIIANKEGTVFYHEANNFYWSFQDACKLGNIEIVKFLIEHKAMLNSGYNTPILNAAINGHFNIIKILVENNVTILDKEFLVNTIRKSGYSDIADYIIKYCE